MLVFNVMSTIWAAEMQRQVLNLMGNELPAWYKTLETSASERQKMHEPMVREGMLLVSIWDGRGWRSAGHVWEVGSAVAKDVALEINLYGIPGEILRVRLDCPPGTWIIDQVQADFSYATGAENAATIMPEKAVDEKMQDVSGLLSEADHKYFIMPTTFRRATVEYRVPSSSAKGLDRTFLLQSSGYYTVHTKDEQKPQSDLFRQILNTPGAYERYVLQQLNEAVKGIVQESAIK